MDAAVNYGTTPQPVSGANWSSMVSWWTDREPSTSFGIDLCLLKPGEIASATIISVEAYETVGDVSSFPSLFVSGTNPDDQFISQAGYPPTVAADTESAPAEGAILTQPCDTPGSFQRVVVGLSASGSEGGGWDGVIVRYTADGREGRLNVPISLFMCGSSTEPCG